jgi:hypothetical protein
LSCRRRCTGSNRRALIQSEWKVTENNRRARRHALTRAGRRHFTGELALWRRMPAPHRAPVSWSADGRSILAAAAKVTPTSSGSKTEASSR